MVMVPLIIMISSDNFYCFLQFEGGHVPQCPIAGDATAKVIANHYKLSLMQFLLNIIQSEFINLFVESNTGQITVSNTYLV
jgi:hypothetical protein